MLITGKSTVPPHFKYLGYFCNFRRQFSLSLISGSRQNVCLNEQKVVDPNVIKWEMLLNIGLMPICTKKGVVGHCCIRYTVV